jgi:hypothetical protein
VGDEDASREEASEGVGSVDADDGARGGVEREALEDILPVRSESEMVRFARRNVRKAAKTDRETD